MTDIFGDEESGLAAFGGLDAIRSPFDERGVSEPVQRLAAGGRLSVDEVMQKKRRHAVLESLSRFGGALVTGSQYGSADRFGPALASAADPVRALVGQREELHASRAEEDRKYDQLLLDMRGDVREGEAHAMKQELHPAAVQMAELGVERERIETEGELGENLKTLQEIRAIAVGMLKTQAQTTSIDIENQQLPALLSAQINQLDARIEALGAGSELTRARTDELTQIDYKREMSKRRHEAVEVLADPASTPEAKEQAAKLIQQIDGRTTLTGDLKPMTREGLADLNEEVRKEVRREIGEEDFTQWKRYLFEPRDEDATSYRAVPKTGMELTPGIIEGEEYLRLGHRLHESWPEELIPSGITRKIREWAYQLDNAQGIEPNLIDLNPDGSPNAEFTQVSGLMLEQWRRREALNRATGEAISLSKKPEK